MLRDFPLQKQRHGQTLLEVMIALSILVFGFLGILSLLGQSLALSKTVGNQTTATYLASEGIEITKSLLDHDVYEHLAGIGTGWGTCFGAGGNFEVDYETTNCATIPKGFTLASLDPLYFDPTAHAYAYPFHVGAGATVTQFSRMITVTPNPDLAIPEITVDSIVTWPVSTGVQSITLEDQFYDWHP